MPRFLASIFMIPTLTIMADFMGVVGGYLYSIHILHIDEHHYWKNSEEFVAAVRSVQRHLQKRVFRRRRSPW